MKAHLDGTQSNYISFSGSAFCPCFLILIVVRRDTGWGSARFSSLRGYRTDERSGPPSSHVPLSRVSRSHRRPTLASFFFLIRALRAIGLVAHDLFLRPRRTDLLTARVLCWAVSGYRPFPPSIVANPPLPRPIILVFKNRGSRGCIPLKRGHICPRAH